MAGTASGPMDIPDSILSAGAAAANAAKHIKKMFAAKPEPTNTYS